MAARLSAPTAIDGVDINSEVIRRRRSHVWDFEMRLNADERTTVPKSVLRPRLGSRAAGSGLQFGSAHAGGPGRGATR